MFEGLLLILLRRPYDVGKTVIPQPICRILVADFSPAILCR
jgi:hypothetical protein